MIAWDTGDNAVLARAQTETKKWISALRLDGKHDLDRCVEALSGRTFKGKPVKASCYRSPGEIPDGLIDKLAGQLKVKSEDTVWSWIKRLLKTQNVMGWFSADGKFIVGMPDYGQAPMFHATRIVEIPGHPFPPGRTPDDNNIEGAEYQESPGQRYSEVYVFGRQGKDPIRAYAPDLELKALGVDRPCYHRDGHIKSIEEANRVAQRMLDDGRIKGTAYTLKLDGFAQGNRLYAFDTIWDVWDDDPGVYVHDLMYCSKLVQKYEESQGPSTEVTLQPRGCIEVPT